MYTVKGNNSAELTFDEVARAARKLGYALRPWVDRQENRRIEATEDRTTEVTEALTGTRTGEILNKGVDSPRMAIQARTHQTQTDARHLSERSNAGQLGHYPQTVP